MNSSPPPSPRRITWQSIEPLSPQESVTNGSIAALDALRDEWKQYLAPLSESERRTIRQKTLRRLSIETGILERLYDIDWGLTLNLVAEGFARDVVERAGGQLDDSVIATLRAQMETLGLVLDFVRDNRRLTPGFIKELHASITRTQPTYTATDALGRTFEAELPRGQWKTAPNHVLRSDDAILEYAPPEQVASEIDRLIELFERVQVENVHPLVTAAWLHHRFVQIHPFADGNGRVARALTVLVLEKHHYAPLVIDRFHRADYIKALEAANTGSLTELITLFTRLESSALASELERPEPQLGIGLSSDVAHTLAEQFRVHQKHRNQQIKNATRTRTIAVAARLQHWFERKRSELETAFTERQVAGFRITVDREEPGGSRGAWFKAQVITSAREAGHYADLSTYAGWTRLKVKVEALELWFIASIHGVGRTAGGIMAVTTLGEVRTRRETSPGEFEAAEIDREPFIPTKDAFRFVHRESLEAITERVDELETLLDEGLTDALTRLLREI